MTLSIAIVVCLMSCVQTQAPGDGDALCTEAMIDGVVNHVFSNHPVYPDNIRPLMDSRDYINLLYGSNGAYTPWQTLDIDNNSAIETITQWTQTVLVACEGEVTVCGFSEGAQENWLITQHVNTSLPGGEGLSKVTVQLEGYIDHCNDSDHCTHYLELHMWETSLPSTNTAMNINNYVLVDQVSPQVTRSFLEYRDIYLNVDNESGFYLAVVDRGTCVTLTRILVLYYVCPDETSELISRPETIETQSLSPSIPVNGECVENSSTETGTTPVLICGSRGEWQVIVPCLCDPGYQLNTTLDQCEVCEEGTFSAGVGNDICKPCPANTKGKRTGLISCPCLPDYYRALYELPTNGCTHSPGSPLNLTVSDVTNTSVSLSWSPPVNRGGRPFSEISYTITARDTGGVGVEVIVREVREEETTVTGLSPGVNYTFSVTAENDVSSQDNNIILRTISITATTEELGYIPSGAPGMFIAVAGQREVVFSWAPPPVTQQNGVITSYNLSCSPSPSSLPQSLSSQSGPLSVTGFSPNTHYSCSLVATNSRGSGPPATTSFTTLEDFAYFQLILNSVLDCSQPVAILSADRKINEITTTVNEVLESSCPECVEENVIDNEFLVCYPGYPMIVTYRARLEGTSVRDSNYLISLIEDWVRGGASVIVTGVLMTVDSDCPVAISSLTDPQCSLLSNDDQTTNTTNHTSTIVGGVFAVIIIIAIVIICIVILRHKKYGRIRFSIAKITANESCETVDEFREDDIELKSIKYDQQDCVHKVFPSSSSSPPSSTE